jgi:hypothetical protein
MSSAHYTINGKKQSTSSKFGLQAGISWKIPFETNLYFAPAIFYSLKGYEVEFTEFSFPPGPEALDNETRIHTGELAFLLQYDFGKKPSHFFLRGGPTLDFQLSGTEKFNLMAGGVNSQKMKFSFGDYGRYAANLLLHFGFETSKGLQVYGQYSHGLASINNADGGPVIKHRGWGLSLGKLF